MQQPMLPARSTLSRKPILIDLPMSMHEIRSSPKASPAIKESTINETWTNFLKRSTISDTTQAKSDAPKIFPLASLYTAHRSFSQKKDRNNNFRKQQLVQRIRKQLTRSHHRFLIVQHEVRNHERRHGLVTLQYRHNRQLVPATAAFTPPFFSTR